MGKTSKSYIFEEMPIARAVMTLSVPTVLSSLVMVIYNLADTYFVGMLNNAVENSAVTLAAPVLLAFNAVNNLFGVGSSSLMSRGLGSKDYDTVRQASVFGFCCSLFSGALFSLLCTVFKAPLLKLLGADSVTSEATGEYLKWTVNCGAVPAILNVVMAYLVRSEGASLHASIGTMSGCVLNIILDPLFILPQFLNMGAAGAGLATFLSNCAACIYFFALLFVKRGKTYVCINPAALKFRKTVIAGIFSVGIPASVQNLLNVTGMTILNNFTADFGETAVAAMGISQKINMLPVQIALGFSQGIMPLVSYNYASENYGRMKRSITLTAKIMLSFLLTVSAVYYIFADGLTSLFMEDPEIVAYGERFLRGFCLGIPFLCIDFLAVGIFQACGFGGRSLLFAILRKIVLEIPALFILNRLFPLYGLAYAQFTAEFVLSIAAAAVLATMFRKFNYDKENMLLEDRRQKKFLHRKR